MDQTESTAAGLEAHLVALQSSVDTVWILCSAALVFFMQVGFLLLEAGSVRSKSSVNVAQKNLADMLMSIMAFQFIGFPLMFGVSVGGWVGLGGLELTGDMLVFFVFQAAFVSTCATIASGAVAERMSFNGYIFLSALIAIGIYPVIGHWIWGGAVASGAPGWLAGLGFMDFAGSTVVHAVGGFVSLAAIMVLGPRIGRFDAAGRPIRLQGHSAVFVTAGVILILVGWIGFNGGSTLAVSADLGMIVAVTLLAAMAGGLAGLILGRIKDGLFRPTRMTNGMLAGLVAVTAGANVLSLNAGILLGVLAGLTVVISEDALLERFGLDDVVGAVSVHGFAGALGTIMLALLAPVETLAAGGRMAQLGVQTLGVGAAFAWAFGLAYLGCRILNAFDILRVPEAHERMGLNAAEHGETLGTGALQSSLVDITRVERDLTRRLDESTGDEAAELAGVINPFLDDMQSLMKSVSRRAEQVAEAAETLGDASQTSLSVANSVAAEGLQLRGTTQAISGSAGDAGETLAAMERESHAIASSSVAVSEEIDRLNAAARDLTRSIEGVSADAASSGELAAGADRTTRTACDMMKSLERASARIDEIVGSIEDLAGQTNLLALNATIEAARAGEAGRGFAVVAGEVKALSDDTRNATQTVAGVLRELRAAGTAAQRSVEEVREVVGSVTTALSAISEATTRQSVVTSAFSKRTFDTAKGAADVAEGVHGFTDRTRAMLGATTDLVRNAEAGADSLSAKAEESLDQARRIDAEAARLGELSKDMTEIASLYNVR